MTKHYSKEEILKFLRENPVMSAAVNSAGSMPISTVLLFSIDDDFTLYFAARDGSHKAIALEADPKISMSVWKINEMHVQMVGTVTKANESTDTILDKLANSSVKIEDFWPPLLRIDGGDYSVYRVKIKWVRALDLSANLIKDAESSFTEYSLDNE